MPESDPAAQTLLAEHAAKWNDVDLVVVCACGARHLGGYFAHVASLLGTDESGAREVLLEAHTNVEVNAGMCGGCDTCGADSAAVSCPICGDGYDPCLTYYEAAGQGPSTQSNNESQQ